ncbi:BadM/Rrf2 family transcriptional regulator [Anaerobacterium chartisolvens]|uniref:BadM/Rrf2 family transcriptional regulator n=1 Tax=Anaerobacterium chartisolvens TaxID=1297424 RepID=A0A369B6Y1_9FIRM|nr:Rrf2 family transcriptional regulator [Anaerobacterium chartisolvens]RCX17263.1 BadM/Rrf2 family transcriptional regulator [Anaerobacterium chartisolvens]
MKLSTKGRYGLRAMVDLAVNSGGDHVALYSIAERQGISENYLEQVFSTLRKAGLVRSVKGAQGGYILASDPSAIKVGTVLRALEGELLIADEEVENSEQSARSVQYCIKVNVWDKINESINSVVDSMTLEDLVNEHKRLSGDSALMFYI